MNWWWWPRGLPGGALALNIAAHAAIKHRRRSNSSSFCSLEMSKESLVIRLCVCSRRPKPTRTAVADSRAAKVEEPEPALGRLGDAPLLIEGVLPDRRPDWRRSIQALKMEKGLDLMIVDYLQLVLWQGHLENRPPGEDGLVSRSLEEYGRRSSAAPGLALSRLSRAPARRNLASDLSSM